MDGLERDLRKAYNSNPFFKVGNDVVYIGKQIGRVYNGIATVVELTVDFGMESLIRKFRGRKD